ncbi:hypothetical protein L873DRAFT_1799152 [Choiromyces venosus 120613-1]|uniref:Uncharacterized protein n=1 Tax=Choiromyces venosus 120613-1 TaxID=1336337 RepID=A0A3N4K2B4_9PEZI|nr:hypothetical protein L873DRAFT_1280401 [Choiromyces venosus 120613-1]RPB04732.1 hypothetical protein L873DRAFT_1799152 [Choiromyces venosus 120613-1]
MFRFTTQRFPRQMFACLQRRGFAHSQMRSTNKLLSAADSSGAKFTFSPDNMVGRRLLKLETDYKVSTETLAKQIRNINTNLTKLEVRTGNVMCGFLAFFVMGAGILAIQVPHYNRQVKKDMLGTVNTLVAAGEDRIKVEILKAIRTSEDRMKEDTAKQIRALEDRIMFKLNRLKGMK